MVHRDYHGCTVSPVPQVLRRDREDLDARYDRAMLYADMGENRKAIEGLEQVGGGGPAGLLRAGWGGRHAGDAAVMPWVGRERVVCMALAVVLREPSASAQHKLRGRWAGAPWQSAACSPLHPPAPMPVPGQGGAARPQRGAQGPGPPVPPHRPGAAGGAGAAGTPVHLPGAGEGALPDWARGRRRAALVAALGGAS